MAFHCNIQREHVSSWREEPKNTNDYRKLFDDDEQWFYLSKLELTDVLDSRETFGVKNGVKVKIHENL